MAIFEYNALTAGGRLMKGTIEAGSQAEAGKLLEDMELNVNSLQKSERTRPQTPVGRSEFLLFNQQLASIAKAGIPLERGLRELSKDISSRSMRRLIDSIAADLEAGAGIEEAFEKHQKSFPPLYGRILKAGVETGRLGEMLTSLNRHIEMSTATRRIIFEALTYPAVVFVLASIIVTCLFIFVIPSFEDILADLTGGSLPPLTQAFFVMSENIMTFWVTVGSVVAAAVAAQIILSSSREGRSLKERIMMKIPIIGRVYHSSLLSRLTEAMAMMVSAGNDMPTCLRLASGASGSERLSTESEAVAGQVEQGANILEAAQHCRVIPRLVFYSVQVGSQRNELQDNLYSLGHMYSTQARTAQAKLQSILLPVMIVLLGCFIALMVLSMFLPMVQVVTSLSAAG